MRADAQSGQSNTGYQTLVLILMRLAWRGRFQCGVTFDCVFACETSILKHVTQLCLKRAAFPLHNSGASLFSGIFSPNCRVFEKQTSLYPARGGGRVDILLKQMVQIWYKLSMCTREPRVFVVYIKSAMDSGVEDITETGRYHLPGNLFAPDLLFNLRAICRCFT